MSDAEREELKGQVRAMIAGRGDGIDLDTPNRWVIEGLKSPKSFFSNLQLLLPPGTILYIEGTSIVPEAARFYEIHRAKDSVFVTRDTIFPVPDVFHVTMEPETITGLLDLLAKRPRQECFDHLKGYRQGRLLFTFHDAFDGYLLISEQVLESKVGTFCRALEVSYRREKNEIRRDAEQLKRFLHAMENPKTLRMNWPWWKRLLLFWVK